jgi:hypothetical protein
VKSSRCSGDFTRLTMTWLLILDPAQDSPQLFGDVLFDGGTEPSPAMPCPSRVELSPGDGTNPDGAVLPPSPQAHNGMSAKIVQETGFKGIWASGMSISAALGVRDNNEASWTQVLEVVEFMSHCTSVPILMDGDQGHGNFNNARRLTSKLESRGVAGVCLEDKTISKANSFLDGELDSMAEVPPQHKHTNTR